MNDERTEPVERTLDATFDPALEDALWDPSAVQPDELSGLCRKLSVVRFQPRPLDLDPTPLPGRPGRPAHGSGRWVGLATGIGAAAVAATFVARCAGPTAHDTQNFDGAHTKVAAPPQDSSDHAVSPSLDADVGASSSAASPTGELAPTLRAPDDGTMRWAPGDADTEPAPPGATAPSHGAGPDEGGAKIDIDGEYTTEWDDDFARRLSVALDAKSVAFSACFDDAGMPADADTVSVHFWFKGATGRLDRLELHRDETRLLAPERCFVDVAREIQVESFEAPAAALVREYVRGETVRAGHFRPHDPDEVAVPPPPAPAEVPAAVGDSDVDLPTHLSATQLMAGISKVKAELKSCIEEMSEPTAHVAKISLRMTIAGSTGATTKVEVLPPYNDSDQARCLRDAMMKARFPRFAFPEQQFTYRLSR